MQKTLAYVKLPGIKILSGPMEVVSNSRFNKVKRSKKRGMLQTE